MPATDEPQSLEGPQTTTSTGMLLGKSQGPEPINQEPDTYEGPGGGVNDPPDGTG